MIGMVYRGDVYDALDICWLTTRQVAERVERTCRRQSAHEAQVWQCLDRLAGDGMAERQRIGSTVAWRRVR